jgi:hypothetical protein
MFCLRERRPHAYRKLGLTLLVIFAFFKLIQVTDGLPLAAK